MSIDAIALCLSLVTFILVIFAIIRLYFVDVDVNAMKKSTHQIQYIDPNWSQSEDEISKVLDNPIDFEGTP